ncbi:MAG: tRNA pseudouridine(38-40) synthase TruA [Eubacteriales bacterium]|nr:tRNA pseudouridine(38-40) synthase TruA [Eubacteriales bacterium]
MRTIKLTVASEGTAYCRFQKQSGSGLPTIQDALETALSNLAKAEVPVTGAGRTDAGVHALAQVVHFTTGEWAIPTDKIAPALNSRLPDDIVAVGAEEVAPDFHARYNAVAKTYVYSIYNRKTPSPFRRLYTCHVPWPLDTEAMRQAAKYLVGQHDFSSFQASGRPVKSAIRTIFGVDIGTDGSLIRITVRGNGFLYQMVRIISGTLIEVGRGKLSPDDLPNIIEAKNRTRAGETAPPQGLRLEKVEY